MNFGELKAEAFRRLSESSADPVFWSEDDIEEAINEGYLDFCERTGCVEREAEVQCVGKVALMDSRTALAYPFLAIRRAWSRILAIPLRFATLKNCDDVDRRWEMAQVSPTRILMRGLYIIGLYPVPPGAERFRMSWTSLPDKLVDDIDEPQIETEFQEAPLLYALYDLKAQEAEADLALSYYAEYMDMTDRAKVSTKDLIQDSREFIMGGPTEGGGGPFREY